MVATGTCRIRREVHATPPVQPNVSEVHLSLVCCVGSFGNAQHDNPLDVPLHVRKRVCLITTVYTDCVSHDDGSVVGNVFSNIPGRRKSRDGI